MNTAALTTLTAILERGSFAAAASAIGCTPSAVSLQVKQLEHYFGQPLFDRSARAVQPTAFAQEVGTAARELLDRLAALRAHRPVTVSGRVRLGAITSIQTDALPPVLRLLRDRHPALEVQVALHDSDQLMVELRAGRIDAAALVRPAAGGSSRLLWHNLVKQPFVLLVPADAPPATPAELLQRLDWIRYDPALTGGRIAADYVKRMGPRARCAMTVQSIDAIVAMVSARLGASVVPQPRAALLDAHRVRAVGLGRGAPTRQIALARRRGDEGNRNIDALRHAFAVVYGRRGNA